MRFQKGADPPDRGQIEHLEYGVGVWILQGGLPPFETSFAQVTLDMANRSLLLIPIALPISNVFLLKGDRPILIDTGQPRDADAITNALRIHGVALADLSLLLHTHAHWDHCGSTKTLRESTSAAVAVHHVDAAMMRRGDNGVLKPANLAGRLLQPFLDHRFPAVDPDLLIREEISLAPFGVAARVLFTPGHTDGSISVLTDEGDAIVGDLLMGGFLGGKLFPRRPGLHYFANELDVVRASIRKVLDMSPRRILPGHGGPLEPDDVDRWLRRCGR